MFWNLIQIRILKVRVSQLENTKLFHPFQKVFWTFLSALTKMHNSAILTSNQCPQMCYTTTSLVNWIIELMLKYYGSVFFIIIIHEEILLERTSAPRTSPVYPMFHTRTWQGDKTEKMKTCKRKNSKSRHQSHGCKNRSLELCQIIDVKSKTVVW